MYHSISSFHTLVIGHQIHTTKKNSKINEKHIKSKCISLVVLSLFSVFKNQLNSMTKVRSVFCLINAYQKELNMCCSSFILVKEMKNNNEKEEEESKEEKEREEEAEEEKKEEEKEERRRK